MSPWVTPRFDGPDRWVANSWHANEFTSGAWRILQDCSRRRHLKYRIQVPLAPKPPGAPAPELDAKVDPRKVLVDWMTAPDNPFFARAMVNRVWGNFFGRGLVEPVDDLRASNPPVNAELLDALAKHFVKVKYDQKALIRTVMQSRLYQLSHTPNETNTADTRNFSRMYLRRLRAEVLMDAIGDVTGVPSSFSATWPGARAVETWNFKISSEFLDAFGRPNSSSDPPCERNTKGTIVQSLGSNIDHIIVSDLNNDTFYAKIVLQVNGTAMEVDSRPSDAIALAVRVKVPIYVSDEVMEKAGVALDTETGKPIIGGQPEEKAVVKMSEDELKRLSAFKEFIGSLDLEDFEKKQS